MRNTNQNLLERQGPTNPAFIKRWILISLAASILLISSGAAAQFSFERFVVFGNSLSDPGNAFILTGQSSIPPYDALDSLLISGGALR